jgi:ribosomal protein S27E
MVPTAAPSAQTHLIGRCPGCGMPVEWPDDGSRERRCADCETILVESVGGLDIERAVHSRLYRHAGESLDVPRLEARRQGRPREPAPGASTPGPQFAAAAWRQRGRGPGRLRDLARGALSWILSR